MVDVTMNLLENLRFKITNWNATMSGEAEKK